MIANPPPYDGDGQTTLRGTPNALAVPTSRNAPCRHLIPRLRRRVGCLHLQPIPCREHNPLTLRAIRPTHRNEHQSTNQLINSHGRPRAPFNLGNSADFRFSAKWKISLSRHGPSFPAGPHTPPPLIFFRLSPSDHHAYNRQNRDSDSSRMGNSDVDTNYSSDMENITSSNYPHTYGKRRFDRLLSLSANPQKPWNAQQSVSSP